MALGVARIPVLFAGLPCHPSPAARAGSAPFGRPVVNAAAVTTPVVGAGKANRITARQLLLVLSL